MAPLEEPTAQEEPIMWYTERLVNGTWSRIAPWGNVDNAIDSAEFLADLCKVETRIIDESGCQVWPTVEPAAEEPGRIPQVAPVRGTIGQAQPAFRIIEHDGMNFSPVGPSFADQERAEEQAQAMNRLESRPAFYSYSVQQEPAPGRLHKQAQEQAQQAPAASLAEEAHAAFGSCNWLHGLPVPMFFELRAIGQEAMTGQVVTFESGFWYDGQTQTHAAKVRIGDLAKVWRIGANSARWYS